MTRTQQSTSRDDFRHKHGDDCITIDEWLVFSDGAMMQVNSSGLMKEPPTEKSELLKIQTRYHDALLRRALHRSEELQRELAKEKARNRPPPVNPREQFAMKHGNNSIDVGDGWLLFSDGAMMERTGLGVMREPPSDAYDRSKLVVEYREDVLRRAVNEFDFQKQRLNSLAAANLRSGYGPPDEREMLILKQLQKVVRQRQKELDEARKELVSHKPAHWRQREAGDARNRAANASVLGELQKIKV